MIPLILKDVEVTNIVPNQRIFFLIIHVKAAPIEMGTARMREHIAKRIAFATKYLIDEGWINTPHYQWKAMVSSVCHPK